MKIKTIGIALASLLALGVATSAANAAVQLDNQTIPTYFGTGNSPCCWATSTNDGLQLGLKFQVRGVANPIVPTSDIYTVPLGTSANIDFSIDPSLGYGTSLAGGIYSLTIRDWNTGVFTTYDPTLIPDNATNGAGGVQNSEYLGFNIVGLGADYNANSNDTFEAVLTAFSATGQFTPFSVADYLVQGSGTPGFTPIPIGVSSGTPEPATWGLMIAGFGLMGIALRRRQRFASQDFGVAT